MAAMWTGHFCVYYAVFAITYAFASAPLPTEKVVHTHASQTVQLVSHGTGWTVAVGRHKALSEKNTREDTENAERETTVVRGNAEQTAQAALSTNEPSFSIVDELEREQESAELHPAAACPNASMLNATVNVAGPVSIEAAQEGITPTSAVSSRVASVHAAAVALLDALAEEDGGSVVEEDGHHRNVEAPPPAPGPTRYFETRRRQASSVVDGHASGVTAATVTPSEQPALLQATGSHSVISAVGHGRRESRRHSKLSDSAMAEFTVDGSSPVVEATVASPYYSSYASGRNLAKEALYRFLNFLHVNTSSKIHQEAQLLENSVDAKFAKTSRMAPSGSDIWNNSKSWVKLEKWHPAGIISNINRGIVHWADVSFISWRWLVLLSMVTYPVIPISTIMVLTVVVSMFLVRSPGHMGAFDDNSPPMPCLAVESLTPLSRKIYASWRQFCHIVPALMVFGVPSILVFLSWMQPQEIFSSLSLLTSIIVFLTMSYVIVYATSALLRMHHMRDVDWGSTKLVEEQLQAAADQRVQHWVIVPQYKEDYEVVAMMLNSVCQSTISHCMINILLAMEEREAEAAAQKGDALKARFRDRFNDIQFSWHPPNLPNDPPGKASNVSWAFKSLTKHLRRLNVDTSRVVITVADADSEFHKMYFECLTHTFLSTEKEKRERCIWQSPIYHMKNYHRQPCFVIVGTVLTCLHELASLGDPHAVRFPYSTYSLSFELAWRVGGWDAEWIAEDWHMGIKCFLLTLGECVVEPIMLPTVNYTPEDTCWYTTIVARWIQAKRHALGFSDLTYYFMMLPLVFGHCVTNTSEDGSLKGLANFWNMLLKGFVLCMKIVNVHVILGVLSTYCALTAALKLIMCETLSTDRHIMFLITRIDIMTQALCFISMLFMVVNSGTFLMAYSQVKERLEGETWRFTPLHLLHTSFCLLCVGPVFVTAMVAAVWKAALSVTITETFEYEVAKKPTSQNNQRQRKSQG
eukprot:TRINITY_DN5452_c0_g1_i1.p1 TRINITY_DN5452_c0_g1~~TRINITY_DN5452_c0_g1_i1.p1  ORF type:complete len:978 (+),score=142.93 TRINITY_DN5452_c0_g1_i1:138-3071(+)